MQNIIKKTISLDVLIVEDEEDIADLIADVLKSAGFTSRVAFGSRQAFIEVRARVPNAIILDLWLKGSDLDGLGILEKIKASYPLLPVVVISGHGTIETAISAIKLGAYDYIAKPLSQDKLLITLKRACEASRLKKENIGLRSKVRRDNELVGQSALISKLRNEIEKVASNNSRVLIEGHFGCEQEIVAHMIHSKSSRAGRPMVTLNANLTEGHKDQFNLFGSQQKEEADLLGRKISIFEAAHGSTLYLQDVTFFSLDTQKQLLSFLQCSRLPNGVEELDVRIIASVRPEIHILIEEGKFLADLYERLSIVRLKIPSLEERREDIRLLVRYYASKISSYQGLRNLNFTNEALAMLENAQWPANLRQLSNTVEHALLISQLDGQTTITSCALSGLIQKQKSYEENEDLLGIESLNFRQAKRKFECYYLNLQMARFRNNISKTSDFIDMERSALHRKLKSLGLNVKE